MWDRKEIKAAGKIAFKANYWKSVFCAFLVTLLAGGGAAATFNSTSDNVQDIQDNSIPTDDANLDQAITDAQNAVNSMSEEDKATAAMIIAIILGALAVIGIVGFLVKLLVFNPLKVGCYGFFKDNAAGSDPDLGIIKTGFDNYGHTFATMLLTDVFLILWTCLFIVPGMIKTYSYRMVPFILRDNPDMSAKEVITASRNLMNGHKWQTFVFDLSYIGWYLLGVVTLNLVNIFWTEPYRQNANGALYLKLTGQEGAPRV